jgi:hypothetical protein
MAVSTDCPLLSLLAKRSVRCRPRLQHGAVELTPKAVQDATGALAEPYRPWIPPRCSTCESDASELAFRPDGIFVKVPLRVPAAPNFAAIQR